MTRAVAIGLLVFAPLFVAACGDGDGDATLTVSAAASLTEAFEEYGDARNGNERFSFGGSDELAAQIREGALPDVYAAASMTYPERLYAEGLVAEPVAFASNELVVAVPRDGEIATLADLAEPDVDLLIGARGVPVGDYAREALDRLPAAERNAILANVRSEESDVRGIVGKLVQGAADAGFVYTSDVAAVEGELRAITLPPELEPVIAYGIAVVEGTGNESAAREFIDGLLDGAGAQALRDAGFLPPADR